MQGFPSSLFGRRTRSLGSGGRRGAAVIFVGCLGGMVGVACDVVRVSDRMVVLQWSSVLDLEMRYQKIDCILMPSHILPFEAG